MTSKLTREERVQALYDLKVGQVLSLADIENVKMLSRMALAAMDCEPNRNPVLPYADSYRDMAKQGVESVPIWSVITDLERNIAPLYRHAQQPVVPGDVLDALQKVARIRLDLNDFDGDRRGIADCLGDAEEALIEVVNRRAAMIQAGNSPVIPGAEKRIADAVELLKQAAPAILADNSGPDGPLVGRVRSPVIPEGYVMVPKEPTEAMINAWLSEVANWRGHVAGYKAMLAAAPQEVKGE